MNENRLARRTIFAALTALSLLGVFILANYYRNYRESHQTIDPLAAMERENLPQWLEGKGKRLAVHDFETGSAADTASHLALPGHRGRQSLKLNSNIPFSPGLWIKFRDLKPGDSSWIRATGYVWFTCMPSEVKCSLVATCNHNGVNYKYMSVPVEKLALKPNQWNRVTISYRIPVPPDAEDVLQVYFWYRGTGEMLVDDIEVVLFK